MAKPKIKIREIKSKIKIIEKKDESLEDEVQEEFEESGESMQTHSQGNMNSGLVMTHRGGDEAEDVPQTPRTADRPQPAGQTYQTAERDVQEKRAYSSIAGRTQQAPTILAEDNRRTMSGGVMRGTQIAGSENVAGSRVRENEAVREDKYSADMKSSRKKMPWEM
jgi:beta-galactosidase GanA